MNPSEMIERARLGGFKHAENVIHVFQGGSHQHGASIPGTVSDVDIFGIYIEEPVQILGVSSETHFTGGTQDQYVRNQPGDEDYKFYTLQRWAGLACKGNPTVLGFLYAPCEVPSVWQEILLANSDVFHASSHGKAFLGYAQGQIARLKGTSGKGKHGQRPELEARLGYDTKAAMHLMRLMFEAKEYVSTGYITYPSPERELLLSIRQGEWSFDKLISNYHHAEAEVLQAMKESRLPEKVDRNSVSTLITQCYIQHWKDKGYLAK